MPRYFHNRGVEVLAPGSAGTSLDLAANPMILLDRDIPASQMRLHGVGLGQPSSGIPRQRILFRSGDDVRSMEGNWFCAVEGAVHRIVVEERRILSRLPFRRPGDVTRHLGPAEMMEKSGLFGRKRIYFYPARGLIVQWNDRESRVESVTLQQDTRDRIGHPSEMCR